MTSLQDLQCPLFVISGSGHFVSHVLFNREFYKVDDDRPIIRSDLASINKSSHFIYQKINRNTDNYEDMYT